MYRPTDIVHRNAEPSVFVVEQYNHRVSKWLFTAGMFDFRLAAGEIDTSIPVVIDNAGTGYTVGDQIIFPSPDLDIADPIQATAEVLTTTGSPGPIATVLVTNIGNGYSGTTITSTDIISPGGGINGQVTYGLMEQWGDAGTVGIPGTPTSVTDDHFNFPTGVGHDLNHIYVADTLNNRFKIINTTTAAVDNNIGTGGQGDNEFYRPANIAFSNTGATNRLIITDSFNHRVVRYDLTSVTNPVFIDVADAPVEGYHTPNGSMHSTIGSDFVYVSDLIKGRIAEYNGTASNTPVFRGTPGTDSAIPSELFYPGQGHGNNESGGSGLQIFADTRNNEIKTIEDGGDFTNVNDQITPGTLGGQLYYPASTTGFDDSIHYNLVANTLNNRVDVFNGSWVFQLSFGSP